MVVLVAGTSKPDEGSIVATQIIRQPGPTPIAFRLVYETAAIDPNVTYTVQAGIVDSAAAWATAKGTKVITNGAPESGLALVLAYRPDLVKGAVTGNITGVGVTASAQAYSVAVLVDPASGESLGMDMNPVGSGLPTAFSIPFSLDTIDPATDYVVTGEVVDGAQTWENDAGVPVITKGNPIADVQVVVTPVVAPSPSPGIGAAEETGPSDSGPGLLLIVIALIVGGIGFYLWSRSRSTPPAAPAAALAAEPAADTATEPAGEAPGEVTAEPPAEAASEEPPTEEPPTEPPAG